jgi:hypothetical protein
MDLEKLFNTQFESNQFISITEESTNSSINKKENTEPNTNTNNEKIKNIIALNNQNSEQKGFHSDEGEKTTTRRMMMKKKKKVIMSPQ